MFLSPSPPRLSKHSRLENLLLLLLRMSAIVLIAVAFMRPLWSNTSQENWSQISGRRVMILLDASASMKRGELWSSGVEQVQRIVTQLEPADEFSIALFDHEFTTLVGFESTSQMSVPEKRVFAQQRLAESKPSWGRGDLGLALAIAAERLATMANVDEKTLANQRLQIELVSDFQASSAVERLQEIQWPADVFVRLHALDTRSLVNTSLQVLMPQPGESDLVTPRIRVRNHHADETVRATVAWKNGWVTDSASASHQQEIVLPPGVAQTLPLLPGTFEYAQQFVLSGDKEDFDNRFYLAPSRPQVYRVVYYGDKEADDATGQLFFAQRALIETPLYLPQVTAIKTSAELNLEISPGNEPHLLILERPLDSSTINSVSEFLKRGGFVLALASDESFVESCRELLGIDAIVEPTTATRSSLSNYLLLAEIDFQQPLFAPFASSRYNDFTGIRFWRRLPVELAGNDATSALARFDDGTPAIWQRRFLATGSDENIPIGTESGRLLAISFSWHPDDSQFALSNKFVVWLNRLVELASRRQPPQPSLLVNDVYDFGEPSLAGIEITLPDGSRRPADGGTVFQLEQRGIYQARRGDERWEFAVNLDWRESDGGVMASEQLESLGVKLGSHTSQSQEVNAQRKLLEIEREQQQKLWKWFLLAAILVLIFETLWAAKSNGKQTTETVGVPS